MPPSPFDNIFSKVKSGASKTAQQMNLAAKIAKLKLEISTQKGEKERHLKTIGLKTYAIFSKDKTLDGKVWSAEISNELNLIQRIENHLGELQDEIKNLQAEFRESTGQDVVDASDVKETTDDAAGKTEGS